VTELCLVLGLGLLASCDEAPSARDGAPHLADAAPVLELRVDQGALLDGRGELAPSRDLRLPDRAHDGAVTCPSFQSGAADSAPVQIVGPLLGGALLPAGAAAITWGRPAPTPDVKGAFAGTPGQPASHEGVDYVIGAGGPASVPIRATADGVVVYVRLGCPQACSGDPAGMFCANTATRECGAGWGNHVVIAHAGGIFTRYAHLKHASVPAAALVGQPVKRGQTIGEMGNSGRSDTRHLHLELGTRASAGPLQPCAGSQSFDLVYDPEQLATVP